MVQIIITVVSALLVHTVSTDVEYRVHGNTHTWGIYLCTRSHIAPTCTEKSSTDFGTRFHIIILCLADTRSSTKGLAGCMLGLIF